MTGFGRARRSEGALAISVEARSVNHRHLDLQVRLPEAWRATEPAVRELVSGRVSRGRLDLSANVEDSRPGTVRAVLDTALARDLLDQAASLAEGRGGSGLGLRDVLPLPGVVRLVEGLAGSEEPDGSILLVTVGEALDELEAAREREGATLRSALLEALEDLSARVESVRERREPARRGLLDRQRARLAELLGEVEIDESRLAQEAALLVERIDFEEELQRLDGHVAAFRESLDATGAVGKRLDFLAQEIHRELNTLGVKCRDSELSGLVIEGKLACDRLREQLLNVE